jgi:hypothetical protein
MKAKRKRRRLFITHSSTDTWVAEQIAKAARRRGVSVFLDSDSIKVGAEFEADLIKNLNAADELLVLLTPWALKRPYVWAEMGVAWGRRLHIVGVLHGVAPQDLDKKVEATVFLKQRNLMPLNDIEKYFRQLGGRSR